MLSNNLLSDGHLVYYLELAQEDYFFRGGEQLGKWWGACAESIGYTGNVQKEQLRAAFRGGKNLGGRFVPLVQRQKKRGSKAHRPGVGLTFSCPKSVSVLWARSGRKRRKRIEQLFEESVACALTYAEKHLVKTRRGHLGMFEESCKLMAALFQHGTNRELEPQLHMHVLVMNICLREDGTTGTIVNDLLFSEKKSWELFRELSLLVTERLKTSHSWAPQNQPLKTDLSLCGRVFGASLVLFFGFRPGGRFGWF